MTIKTIRFDSSGEEHGEYVEVYNHGPQIIDLSGWKVNADNEGQNMLFPKGCLCYPQQSLRIYTRGGHELSFNSQQSVWNNKGAKAFLYDGKGELVLCWRYGTKAHDAVAITHICFDDQGKYTEADEYVELTNLCADWVDLSSWQLSAGKDQNFTFPAHTVLKPHARIRLYTNHIDQHCGGYSFNSPRAIWNNKGGSGELSDYKGNVVSEYHYGTKQ